MRTLRRALFRIAVLVCLLAVAAGGWWAWSGYRATARPQDVVASYFGAVSVGDAAGALSYGPLPAGDTRAWLTGEVLARQLKTAALHDVRIGPVTRSGDTASVQVDYRLRFRDGDRGERATVHVTRSGGRWRLATTAVPTTLVVQQAQDRVSLAGAGVPAGRVLLFPGAVPVQLDTKYLQAGPATVTFGGTGTTQVEVTPTAAAQRTIATNVVRQLTACLSNSRTAHDCPLPSPRAVPGSVSRITTLHRSVRVTLGTATAGVFDVRGSITVRGTYRTLTFDNTEQVRTGRLTLPFHAAASPFAPLRVYFGGQT